ncbi:hypothetical protein BVC80_1537g17 [Macleaya cordata]|uniref:Uncharacterized protein n=1 Tax=Macleaya cordata TaxID=56857 RepID=A0A200R9H6_MACCD|nr:hypothetical protein BVC80_1537g17 [Macleaya cordata]
MQTPAISYQVSLFCISINKIFTGFLSSQQLWGTQPIMDLTPRNQSSTYQDLIVLDYHQQILHWGWNKKLYCHINGINFNIQDGIPTSSPYEQP